MVADEATSTGESESKKKGSAPAKDPIFLSGTQVSKFIWLKKYYCDDQIRHQLAPLTIQPFQFLTNWMWLTNFLGGFCIIHTKLIGGSGIILAICVGETSYNGRILMSLRTPSEDTPLQEKLAKLANFIGNFGIVTALLIFVAQVIPHTSSVVKSYKP